MNSCLGLNFLKQCCVKNLYIIVGCMGNELWREAGRVVYSPDVRDVPVEVEQVVKSCPVSSDDDIFRDEVPALADSLMYPVVGCLRVRKPEKKEDNPVSRIPHVSEETGIPPAGKCCFKGEGLFLLEKGLNSFQEKAARRHGLSLGSKRRKAGCDEICV